MMRNLRGQVNGHPWIAFYLVATTTIILVLIVLQALGRI